MIRRQRGTALLLVLWVTVLLAALLIGVAAASRSQSQAALYGAERVRAELVAEAGLAHAVAGLRAPDLRNQWVPDGRSYDFEFDGAKVRVQVVDVSGLVDLNASPPDLLADLFAAAGVERARADQFANTLAAWRGDSPRQPLPTRGGAAAQPHGPFRAIEQLARLPGMTAGLFTKVEQSVTVFSGRNFPDASYAPPPSLAALQGLAPSQAEALVAQRRSRPAQRGAGNGRASGAVANGPLVAGYGGVVERVFSTATMPDGMRVSLDVTIRLALTGPRARPYKVLDWRVD
jgi:general secretion pathway protein K